MKTRLFFKLFAAVVVLFTISFTTVYATTLSNADLGIQMKFPEKYTVFSKTGIQNRNELTDETIQRITKAMNDSKIEFIAITQDFSEEIDIEPFKNETFNTFTFLTDAELSEFGTQLLAETKEEIKKMDNSENVKFQTPTIYHHSQTKFLLIESVNGNMHVSQYFTIYNNMAYRILYVNNVEEINTSEAESFVDNIQFLQDPINYPKSKSTYTYSKSILGNTNSKILVGTIAGAIFGFSYFFSNQRKKENQV